MAEINEPNKHTPNEWPYAFCSVCKRLSPVSDDGSNLRVCLSCRTTVLLGPKNTVVFLNEVEAKLRKLPIVKDDEGEE